MEDGIFFNQSKYIKEMLKKFGLEDSKPTKTPMSTEIKLTKDDEADSVDSSKYRGAIDLSKNPVQQSKTKHIEIRHHFLRDNVQKGNISIEKDASEDNIADIFNKPLKREIAPPLVIIQSSLEAQPSNCPRIQQLFCGSKDKSLRLWDCYSGKLRFWKKDLLDMLEKNEINRPLLALLDEKTASARRSNQVFKESSSSSRVGDEEFCDSNKVSPSIVDAQRWCLQHPQSSSAAELEGENAYASFQDLLALARITRSNADEGRDDKDKDPEAIQAAVMSGLMKSKGHRKRNANESSDESDEEESESLDSDYDSKIERDIAKKYGKGLTSKLKPSRKKRDNDDFDEDDLDSKDKIKRGRSKKRSVKRRTSDTDDDQSGRKRRKEKRRSRKEKRRRRSHPHSDDSDRRKEGHRGKTGINYYPNEMFSLEKVSLAVLFDL
ncbi:hypothetical protein Tco_0548254 [Tanacetum coccineum]